MTDSTAALGSFEEPDIMVSVFWIGTVTFLIYLVQNFQQYLDDLKIQLGLAANVDLSGLIIQKFLFKRSRKFQNL